MPALSRFALLLPVALFLGGTVVCPAHAQTEAVRLLRRGKTGDVFKYQSAYHRKGELNISTETDSHTLDTTRKQVYTVRSLEDGKDGNINLEYRIVSGQEDTLAENQETHKTASKAAAVFTTTPDLKTWTTKPVPETGKNGKSVPLAKAAADAVLRDTTTLFLQGERPGRLLRVGDGWTGLWPRNPYSKENEGDPLFPYTAKLAAIEPHRGIPCAKVVYDIAYKGDLPSIRAALLKKLPEDSQIEGEAEITGTVTEFITLDRGAVLDSTSKVKTQIKYKLVIRIGETENGKEEHVEGNYDEDDVETAVEFPHYNASVQSKGK